MVFKMEGRMVTDKIQCAGLGLMRSKRILEPPGLCVCMSVSMCWTKFDEAFLQQAVRRASPPLQLCCIAGSVLH